jgi:cell division transport system ATP-binding protein
MENNNTLVKYSGVAIDRGGVRILNSADFEVNAGELVTLEGVIGAGKSTLFKTLYAELPIAEGKAEVLGFDLRKIPSRKISKLRCRMGIVFQDYQLFDNKTVAGNLQFVIDSLDFKTPCANDEYIARILDKVGIPGKADTFPHMLSGGERQSVAIARAIVCKPELVIADEPTGNLDEASAQHIAGLLASLAKEGAGVIVATHDEKAFCDFPHRILKVVDGKIS